MGPLQCTTWVRKIIKEQTKLMRQAASGSSGGMGASAVDMPATSHYNLRVQQYDFYNTYRSPSNPDGALDMPTFYKEQQHGFSAGIFKKHANQVELGYLKMRFFDSLAIFKPAVTVMIFDWQHEPASSFDWPTHEAEILDELKNFQEKCAVTARDTRIILLILLPLQSGTGPAEVSLEKCRTSLRSALA